MNLIFVLYSFIPYEGIDIEGVTESREKAEEWGKKDLCGFEVWDMDGPRLDA